MQTNYTNDAYTYLGFNGEFVARLSIGDVARCELNWELYNKWV
jgi:hypothetical protein